MTKTVSHRKLRDRGEALSIARAEPAVPSLRALHPAAARWIGALIRMTAPHPAMTRILNVIERLQDHPVATNFVLLGEPGTGKEGLARALHHLVSPDAPLVRFDVAGFPEDQALTLLAAAAEEASRRGRSSFAGPSPSREVRNPSEGSEMAVGGVLLIEEVAALGPQVQAALLRLLKSGQIDVGERAQGPKAQARGRRKMKVNAIAMSDRDLPAEVTAGRLRHDLFYRLARVVLWLPPLRERSEDIGPAAVWMGNRILRDAGLHLELLTAEDFTRATVADRASAIKLEPAAVKALESHVWPGNLRELEAVIERALLLFRTGATVGEDEIRAALETGGPPAAPPRL